MFTSRFSPILIAGTVALGVFGALATVPTSASADVRGGIYIEGPGVSFGIGDRGFRRGGWYHDRGWDRPRYRTCNPRRAVRKAQRRGLRRAHVVRVGHRGVVVAGRKWGERVVMGFGRHRSCPVRFVRGR